MPHLTNCAHSGDGWCLDCVSKLKTELDDLEDRHAKLYADITKTIINRNKWRAVAEEFNQVFDDLRPQVEYAPFDDVHVKFTELKNQYDRGR